MESNTRLAQDTNTILRRIYVTSSTSIPADVACVTTNIANGATATITLPTPEACIGRIITVRPGGAGTTEVALGPRDTSPTTITAPAVFYCDGIGYLWLNEVGGGE